jgi:hypothetical protein
MKRYNQTMNEIVENLSRIETIWKDPFSLDVLAAIKALPFANGYDRQVFKMLLNHNYSVGICVIQIVLGLSKDELTSLYRESTLGTSFSRTQFLRTPDDFMAVLESFGLDNSYNELVKTPVTWKDILAERLRGGRGSAIKGQYRGRILEDFVEDLVRQVFGEGNYHVRCRFTAAVGTSTEKADFAIPSRQEPCVLIEAKAYGATGSKQTDVIGDVERIIREKRPDTTFLLVVDGESWRARINDLRKLVERQNAGRIARIYTMKMRASLLRDLRTLKNEYAL